VDSKNRKIVIKAKGLLVKAMKASPGFIGAGIGEDPDGTAVVVALVETEDAAVGLGIPNELKGVSVRVEVVGRPEKQGRRKPRKF